MFVVAILLKVANDLQQSGNLDTMNAIGLTGEVYVPILENAKGKVTLIVQERFTEMDAICPAGPLKTGQRVQVTGVVENDVLVVAPIDWFPSSHRGAVPH